MLSALRSLSLKATTATAIPQRPQQRLVRSLHSYTNFPAATLGWSNNSPINSNNVSEISHDSLGAVRFRWTKAKKKRHARYLKRQEMAANGIPVPKPPKYLDPKTTPVVNSIPREEQQRISMERRKNQHLNKPNIKEGPDIPPPLVLPYHTSVHETADGLRVSEKVAKILSLTNATQHRVVQSQKAAGMKLFQMRPGDTGSSSVQVIALTARIQQMEAHLISHPKDKAGKRGTERLRVRRRRMLDYLERQNFNEYTKVVTTLGLR